jgi:hypothetical protein
MSTRRRIAGFDMGSVNYAMAIIEHTPAERRRKVIAAAKLALLPPPVPEVTQLITARIINLKADRVIAKFQRGAKHPITVPGYAEYVSDVSTCDLIVRLGHHIQAITELFAEPLPDVYVEIPGGGPASPASDSYINWQLATATISIVAGIDATLGLQGRRYGLRQKKADVARGTEYEEHKAESVRSMRACIAANADKLAADFLYHVAHAKQKLDDLADAYNLARAADDQDPPRTPEVMVPKKHTPLRERLAKRTREEAEDDVVLIVPPPAKRAKRKGDSLCSSSED